MIVSSTRGDILTELYSLIQWILVGSEEKLQTEVKNRTVDIYIYVCVCVTESVKRGLIAFPDFQVWPVITPNMLNLFS